MTIYDQTLEILKPHLGPAAGKFLDRQVARVGSDPSALTEDSIDDLAKWCSSAAGLLVGDDKAAEIKTKVLALK